MLILSWIQTRRRYQKVRRDNLRVFRRAIKSAFDSLSADFQESNLALFASPFPDRPNYFHPKELYIHNAVGLQMALNNIDNKSSCSFPITRKSRPPSSHLVS